MATGLVLRGVPLLCGDKRRVGWTPRWNEMHSCSYGLSEAQVQAFATGPAPG